MASGRRWLRRGTFEGLVVVACLFGGALLDVTIGLGAFVLSGLAVGWFLAQLFGG